MTSLSELQQRQAVIRDRVRGVALKLQSGFYLFGRPGTSKTYTVRTTLERLNTPYLYHNGHVTPLGLFELLEEHRDRVIVLDDVSAIFGQPIALQILLAALGNQPGDTGVRIVQYRRNGLASTVHFSGGIIAISNLELHSSPVLEALKSRVHYLRYNPSDEQIAALMQNIASGGWPATKPQIKPADCLAIADFLITEAARLDIRLDIRLLIDKAFPDFLQHRRGNTETHWKDLITTTLEEQLSDLKHSSKTQRTTRAERVADERRLAGEIVEHFPNREQRIAAWIARTGKSERAFYRRLEQA